LPLGIVCMHGYTGSPEHLSPLIEKLKTGYGADSVTTVRLPGHGTSQTPVFDRQAFVTAVARAIGPYKEEGHLLVVIGHSTGGVLALSALQDHSISPDLLVLASVPKRIDTAYLERWTRHRSGRSEVPFSSVASMVSLINAVGRTRHDGSFPVLVLHGEEDELVPSANAYDWEKESFCGPVRTVVIPAAEHDLFRGRNGSLAVDVVARAVSDLVEETDRRDEERIATLAEGEPEAGNFLARSASSARHVARCPSGYMIADGQPVLTPCVETEPVFANIEITTRCNLRCSYCARTFLERHGTDMPKWMFLSILGLLPHAYRITLVGLGEPLLHPQIVDFIGEASSRGRRVALVTNGMLLDAPLSHELLKAGLSSIAFSVDAATQEATDTVRPGTDLDRVVENIKAFVSLSKSVRPISTAVFSAVSITTVQHLEELVDVVAGLGVHVMMLSDLNFRENLGHTLLKNVDDRISAKVRSGVARAFKKNLPVLSVRGLEEFGLSKRYGKFLLFPPDQLYRRSENHTWCFSPWQTVPVGVGGDVTLCDCQPSVTAGNLLSQPLSEIWNGEVFTEHRRRMRSTDPPEACKICPRF